MSTDSERAEWTDLLKYAPYYLVVHSGSGYSAVYNRGYELLFEDASDQLLAYAVRFNTQVQLEFGLTLQKQRPSWMRPGMEARCVGYHLYNGEMGLSEVRSIPRR